jgi:hypothetical protein
VVELLNSFLRTCLLTLAAVSNSDLLGGLAALGAIGLDLKTGTINNLIRKRLTCINNEDRIAEKGSVILTT